MNFLWKSIPVRFTICMALMVVPLLAVSLGSQRLVVKAFDQVGVVLGHAVERMVPVGHLNALLLKSTMPAHDYLLYGDTSMRNELEGIANRIDGLLTDTQASPFLTDIEKTLLAETRNDWQDALRVSREVLALPHPVPEEVTQLKTLQIERHVELALSHLETMNSLTVAQLSDNWTDAQKVRGDQTKLVLAATIAVLLLAGIASSALVQMGREIKENEEKFRYQSRHDPLTGLDNRRQFNQWLEDEVARSQRFHHRFSVLMLDLDHFKQVNDSHGHQIGDEVLCAMSRLLQDHLRSIDHAARYGGEEFVVLLPETDSDGAELIANKIRARLASASLPLPDGGDLTVTVSIGVATYPAHARMGEELLAAADEALYQAKVDGRNRVVVASGGPGGFISQTGPAPAAEWDRQDRYSA